MKQVVGLPFTSMPDFGDERDIVEELVEASGSHGREFDTVLDSILAKLRTVLSGRLRTYLRSVVDRLLDPGTNLAWSPASNNCQTFCNSILDRQLFKPLFGGPPTSQREPHPLYAMSFVCADEGHHQRIVRTKHDVAPGLTEEYLGALFFGRHNESDLIDSCQEYWHDWAGLERPECGYGALFPFDCTRAFAGREPDPHRECGGCGLARHLWAFPFDSFSIVSMHLQRGPPRVPRSRTLPRIVLVPEPPRSPAGAERPIPGSVRDGQVARTTDGHGVDALRHTPPRAGPVPRAHQAGRHPPRAADEPLL